MRRLAFKAIHIFGGQILTFKDLNTLVALSVIASLASCSNPTAVVPPPRAPVPLAPTSKTPAPTTAASPAVSLEALAAIFGGEEDGVDRGEEGVDRLPAGADGEADRRDVEAYRAWVRKRLQGKRVYDILMPLITTAADSLGPYRIVGFAELREGVSKRRGPFLYRVTPCPEKDLVAVRPWWKPSSKILVCREDYLPDVFVSKTGLSCDVTWVALFPGTGCGCGPSLMYCGTKPLQNALIDAGREELQLTMREIVVTGRPFGDLLTTNATFRSGYADLFYARALFFLTGKFDPPDLEQPASMRPRDAVFKGGILSSPIYVVTGPHRSLVSAIWDNFLGLTVRSQTVESSALLEAIRGETTLGAATHFELASRVGCQNCHARLEYAQGAYNGWQSALTGTHIDPQLLATQPKQTRFYMRDHTDLRGEGPANLDWLGQMIGSQPEFVDCMVSKITSLVFEGVEIPFEIRRRLTERFADGQDLGSLIEDAVVARAFGLAGLAAGTP